MHSIGCTIQDRKQSGLFIENQNRPRDTSVRKVVNNGAIDKANNHTSSVVENMSHEILS